MDPVLRQVIDILGTILKHFGKDIAQWIIKRAGDLLKKWRARFAKKTIVILGPGGTGKSSLILYMSEGAPFRVVDGAKTPPDSTSGVVILKDNFTLPEGVSINIPNDVTGDPAFRSVWEEVLLTIKPDGIIYMLDGRRSEDALRRDLEELRDLMIRCSAALNSVAALHIFLNFSDRWQSGPGIEHKKAKEIQDLVSELRSQYPEFDHVRVQVSATQLSPALKAWPEAERALKHFSDDLA